MFWGLGNFSRQMGIYRVLGVWMYIDVRFSLELHLTAYRYQTRVEFKVIFALHGWLQRMSWRTPPFEILENLYLAPLVVPSPFILNTLYSRYFPQPDPSLLLSPNDPFTVFLSSIPLQTHAYKTLPTRREVRDASLTVF